MGVILEKAMTIGGLKNCKLVAGKQNLKNNIENVTIMEVPDISRWLQGEELLVTSLYLRGENLDYKKFIQRLAAANVSALAIKPFHFVGYIPQAVIAAGDEVGLPIIEVPEEVSYLDIMSPIMNAIYDQKLLIQKDIEEGNQLLKEVSINGGSIRNFLDTLQYITGSLITIESYVPYIAFSEINESKLSPLSNQEKKNLREIKRSLFFERDLDDITHQCIVSPILLEGEIYGYITAWNSTEKNAHYNLSILEQAAIYISLEFLKLKVRNDVEQQYKSDFIYDLLFNTKLDPKNILLKGQKYDFDLKQNYVCLLFDMNGHNNVVQDNLTKISFVINQYDAHAIVGSVRNYICCVLPSVDDLNVSRRKLEEFINQIRSSIKLSQLVSYIGVGAVYYGVEGIRKSYKEAKKALNLNHHLKNKDKTVFYADMEMYNLLDKIIDHPDIFTIYKNSIQKIVAYDQTHKSKLFETIEVYFNENEHLKETAKRLYIHVNTLKYRIEKINDITGYSLKNTEEKLILFLCTKIHHLQIIS